MMRTGHRSALWEIHYFKHDATHAYRTVVCVLSEKSIYGHRLMGALNLTPLSGSTKS